jgi:hypothetical protein
MCGEEKKGGETLTLCFRTSMLLSRHQEELAALNKRRAEREAELLLREEEDARLARLAESALMQDWVDREDDFHLEQARRRAGIRMRENRAKAIDFLAINLRFARPYGEEEEEKEKAGGGGHGEMEEGGGWGWEEAGLEMDLEEPYKIFEVSFSPS